MIAHRPIWIARFGAWRGVLKQLHTRVAGPQHHHLGGRVAQAGNVIDHGVAGLPPEIEHLLKTEEILVKPERTFHISGRNRGVMNASDHSQPSFTVDDDFFSLR